MPNVPRRALVEAYATWATHRGLTVADIAKASGMSRHTIENVRDGGGKRLPTIQTLQLLAAGIVRASSGTGRYDESIMADCYGDLFRAAGYDDPTMGPESTLLDLAMYYRFRSPGRARRWAALVERFDRMDPDRAWEALEAAEVR